MSVAHVPAHRAFAPAPGSTEETPMSWTRIVALIVKELLAAFRDPSARIALIAPPLVQLFLFAYAATMDVTNVPIGVLNQDWGLASTQLISRLERTSRLFAKSACYQSQSEVRRRHRRAGRDGRRRDRPGFFAQTGAPARRRRCRCCSTAANPTARRSSAPTSARSSPTSRAIMPAPRRSPPRRARSSTAPGTTPTATFAP